MPTNNDRKALKVMFKDDVFDESLFAIDVEIVIAQWGAPARRKDSNFSIALNRRWLSKTGVSARCGNSS